ASLLQPARRGGRLLQAAGPDAQAERRGMSIRSFLFVPGDSERKMAKAGAGPADALILDLEDSVAQDRLPVARGMVLDYLKAHPDRSRQQLWVRCNPLETPL